MLQGVTLHGNGNFSPEYVMIYAPTLTQIHTEDALCKGTCSDLLAMRALENRKHHYDCTSHQNQLER